MAALKGRTAPRIWTPPLRALNRRTSLGFELADFADAIGEPLLPWQRFLSVHTLEVNRDKSPRFSTVVVLVSRQQGKTSWVRTAILHRLHVMGVRLVLGVAADVSLARENWQGCVSTINGCPWLAADLHSVRYANGDETIRIGVPDLTYEDVPGVDDSLTLAGGSRYKICAANRRAGRGLSVDFLHVDELREWRNWDPWAALQPTTSARPQAMTFLTSNAGDSQSLVLSGLREAALSGRDPSIGLFEWSAEPGADPTDPRAWQQACPALGYTFSERALHSAYASMPIGRFRTEYMCQFVDVLDSAVDLAAWRDCADPAGTMDSARERGLACCFDVSPDSSHATLAVAGRLPDGRARVELAGVWTSAQTARAELPALLDRIQPQVTAWYPSGPAGQFATILRPRPGSTEITGTMAAQVCMELASLVVARRVVHGGEEILDQHIGGATRLTSADGWRFGRKGEAPCDAAYAAAGAIASALQLPEPRRARIRLIG